MTKNTKTAVYLAVPYSHPDYAIKNERFNQVNKAAAVLMKFGYHIYSPISHTHPIALAGDLPTDWQFWADYCRAMLANCASMLILPLDGWKESKGIAAEIAIAQELGISIHTIEILDDNILGFNPLV